MRVDDGLLDDTHQTSTGSRLELDTQEIGQLYVDVRLTLNQIAQRFGCGASTIRRRLAELAISPRPRGPDVGRYPCARQIEWSAELAWAVGLLATDGNLSSNGRAIIIVSKDVDLLQTVRRCLGIRPSVKPHFGGFGTQCHRLQWTDRVFYDWLLRIGLMPNKSRRLKALAIPDELFRDFLRGCIDGDGSITVYTDRHHLPKNERYVYERLWVSLVSASQPFVEWIRKTIVRLRGVRGSLSVHTKPGRSPIWKLKYGKRDSIDLIRWMYYAPDVPSLDRKRAIAANFLDVLGYAEKRGVGRPRVGWIYNESLN